MPVDPGSVRFASLCDDEHGFTRSFQLSFLPLLASDLGGGQRIWRGGYSIQGATSSGVVEGRNEVVREFLESSAEWLFFIDSDMGWEPDGLEQLMAAADPVERPIVGGLCFGFGPVGDVLGAGHSVVKRPFPTIFDLAETEDDVAFRPRWAYVPGELQECAATGGAFVIIHRSVLEAIAAEWGDVWFDRMKHPKGKRLWGEDTSFCMRARMLGFPTFVHAGVQTSHSKVIQVTQDVYMRSLVAEPATDEVAVLVPVLERPQNAEPFMRSLRASTGLATVYAITNNRQDAKAWDEVGARLLESDKISFAEKVNLAAAIATDHGFRWVFLVGDDVTFRPGWLDHAQAVARNTGAKVVGTNDQANPRVMNGQHATHMLIATEYITEQGASWDGPGVVCHEGYRHWYVDDEIVAVAKQRKVWAPALASIVEHRHPLFGTAPDDETYRRGQRHAGKDKALWVKRSQQHAQVLTA
ncbi:MAG TPA: hypothetical protein VGK49_08735 [Ilumatobacteraceae bacterium]